MRLRDSQRSRVYKFDRMVRFELQGSLHESMSLEQCNTMIEMVTVHYDLPMVNALGDGRRSRRGAYHRDTKSISLPRHNRNPMAVLHETSHYIMHSLMNDKPYASHGMEFVGIYANLLADYTELTPYWIMENLSKLKIKIDLTYFKSWSKDVTTNAA